MSEQESENPHFKLIHDRLDAILTWGVVIFLVLLLVGVATPNMLVNPKKSQHQKNADLHDISLRVDRSRNFFVGSVT